MFCPQCGTQALDGAKFCGHCGSGLQSRSISAATPNTMSQPLPVSDVLVSSAPMQAQSTSASPVLLALAGFLAGGFVGFLLRPSLIFVGQLPFQAVITRGANLTGIDQLLISAAQQSFNIMFAGAMVGAVVGFIIGRVLAARSRTA